MVEVYDGLVEFGAIVGYDDGMAKLVTNSEPLILLTAADRTFLADFRKRSKARLDRVTKTKESAMQELIDAGIYGQDGKLSKRYRSVA